MEHTTHSGMSSVYHGRPRGIPWLLAFCEDGWEYYDYYPHALDDNVVRAWALHTRDETLAYLPPDPDDLEDDEDNTGDHPSSTVEVFRTLDEAYAHCAEQFGPLHLVWL